MTSQRRSGDPEFIDLDGAPWLAKFVAKVGILSTVVIALLWFVLSEVAGTQKQIVAALNETSKSHVIIVQNQANIVELLKRQEDTMRASLWIQAAMCVNLAETEVERSRCLTMQEPR